MNTVDKVQAIYADLQTAFNEIAKKHNLSSMNAGKIRYDENGFNTTLSVVFDGGDTKEMAKLRSLAHVYGLSEDVCNATVQYSNSHYKIIGMKNTNMILEKDGRKYTAPINNVVESIRNYHKELCL